MDDEMEYHLDKVDIERKITNEEEVAIRRLFPQLMRSGLEFYRALEEHDAVSRLTLELTLEFVTHSLNKKIGFDPVLEVYEVERNFAVKAQQENGEGILSDYDQLILRDFRNYKS